MLHACAVRFDVTGNLENFCELNKASDADASQGCAAGAKRGRSPGQKDWQKREKMRPWRLAMPSSYPLSRVEPRPGAVAFRVS